MSEVKLFTPHSTRINPRLCFRNAFSSNNLFPDNKHKDMLSQYSSCEVIIV